MVYSSSAVHLAVCLRTAPIPSAPARSPTSNRQGNKPHIGAVGLALCREPSSQDAQSHRACGIIRKVYHGKCAICLTMHIAGGGPAMSDMKTRWKPAVQRMCRVATASGPGIRHIAMLRLFHLLSELLVVPLFQGFGSDTNRICLPVIGHQ